MTHGYNENNMWTDIIFAAILFGAIGIGIGYLIWG